MTSFVSRLTVLMLLLLAPAAHAASLLDVDRLAVYDGTGRQVGSTWPTSDPGLDGLGLMYVTFRDGSTPVTVRLRRDGFQFDTVRFAGLGCTGQALFETDWEGLFPFTAVAAPRGTVYVQSGPLKERTIRSTRTVGGGCFNHEEPFRADTVTLRSTTVDLADHFVPPFRTRAFGQTPVPVEVP